MRERRAPDRADFRGSGATGTQAGTGMIRAATSFYDFLVRIGEALMAGYGRIVPKMPAGWILFALIVFLMTFPLIVIRSYHFDEGLTISFALDLYDGGNPWYEPHFFGIRFVERPQLLGWIIGLISWPFGEVHQVVARLPTVLALYGGALLIHYLLKDYVSRAGAIFGALCFLFAPAVLIKVVTAESDVPLSAVSFAAFVVWWRGYREGRNELWRWAAIGLLLGLTALFKGPQPSAFFAVGIGLFLALRREWAALPGYVLAGAISLSMVVPWYLVVYDSGDTATWARFMRLDQDPAFGEYFAEKAKFAIDTFVSLLPGSLAAVVGFIGFRRFWPETADRSSARELFIALLFFAAAGTLAVTLWPGGKTRYLFAALPAIAAMAGLVYDRAATGWRRLFVRTAFGILVALVVYQAVWNWIVSPVFYERFADNRISAGRVEEAVKANPAPMYVAYRIGDTMFPYLDFPVRFKIWPELQQVEAPAWVLVPTPRLEAYLAARPDLVAGDRREMIVKGQSLTLIRLDPR
jgi:4-amino-4-deoxy-L-arabinose transferase-like glycosyltransferase